MHYFYWSLLASLLSLALGDLQVYTSSALKVLPNSNERLSSFAILFCIIEPSNVTVDSRWLLPSGRIVSGSNTSVTDRLVVQEGALALSRGEVFGTVLLIERVSFRDSGMYTCEVREVTGSQGECEEEWPAVTTTELRLQVSLQAVEEAVTALDTDSEVALRCEMTGFIRPDADLQWFRENEPITSEPNNKTIIEYIEGFPGMAQSGGSETEPGRVSVLRISNPAVMDSGTYKCSVRGTEESAYVQLRVTPEPATMDDDASLASSSSSSSSCSQVAAITASATFICATTFTAIATATIVLLWKRRATSRSKHSPDSVEVFEACCPSTVVGNQLTDDTVTDQPTTVAV